jgi:hypothetical protein
LLRGFSTTSLSCGLPGILGYLLCVVLRTFFGCGWEAWIGQIAVLISKPEGYLVALLVLVEANEAKPKADFGEG